MTKRALREEKKQEYLQDPNHCPFCGSENIRADNFEDEGLSVGFRPVFCRDCDKQWDEVWHLVAIDSDDMDEDEIKEKNIKKEQKEEQARKWEERWHKR